MALVVQPLADVGVEEEEVPEIDMGEAVIRCGRCSAYINPFVKFVENGRGYICPFCSTLNSVPEHYFSPIEANGYRRDIAERYELWRGSVDFVAPSEYTTRSKEHSEAPVVLFVIDTSSQAISSGLLKAFVNSARQILEANFTENPNTLFGFITYNKSVQFWRINPTLQAVVVPHVTHVFLPLPSSCFLANYASQRNLIDTFFNEVQSMFSSTGGSGEVAMGAAVNAAMLAFGKHAGRIVLLQNALPQHGPGALKNREEVSSYGKDAEKAFYVPQNKFYSTLGEDCAKRSIQIDLISTGSGYSDLASISELARVTGGHVYYIPGFSIDAHEEKLYYDLFRILTRAHGTEAIGRLRTSEGLVVDSYQGHFLRGDGDVEFGGIDADQTLVIVLKHDGKIEEKKDAFVQFAMVHTNDVGKRLIRVHTLAMHTTNVVSNLFKSSDVSAVFDVLLRRTINNMGKESVQALRTEITSATSSILASYRKYCTKNDRGDAQLILPEALKLLPVHVLGSLKSILFSNPVTAGDSIPSIADARVYMSHLVQTSSLESLIPLFYPRIYGIHKLHRQLELERLKAENKANEANGENESDSEDDEENSVPLPGDEDHYGSYWLPGLIRASASELEAGGVYLMDDGQSIYLALHPPMDSNIFQRLFNENGQLAYNEEDELNRRLWKIIEAIRYRRPNHQLVQLLDTQQNTALRRTFYSRFIEDGSDDYMNREQITTLYKLGYSGYLCHVHRAVQDKI
jgi:protein transport protein SEC24